MTILNSPFTKSTQVILTLALAAAALGCKRELIPPPYVMRGETGRAHYAEVDPAFQKADMPILYVTDRSCDEVGDCGPEYGYRRSRSVDYGIATVSLSPEPTWDQLVIDSTKDAESQPYSLHIKSVEVVGQFQDSITRYSVDDGKLDITQENIRNIRQERTDFCALVNRWLDHSQSKEAFVYVHGFNNTFDDAVFRLAESWHFAGRQGVPIVFTWPAGKGGLTGYAYDRESGEFAVMHLKLLLMALAQCPQVERVHLISHSRGTDVASSALRELHLEVRAATGRGFIGLLADEPLVTLTPEQAAAAPSTAEFLKMRTLVLAAPDLDADVFSQRFVNENLLRAADRIVVYFSQEDSALALAEWLFGSRGRVGDLSVEDFTPQQLELLQKLPSFEMISCDTKGYSSHSYMFMHPAAFSDLLLVLRDECPPGAEHGRPLEQPREGLWQLNNDYLKPPKSK